ncbi:MAG: hypothetical protein ABI616_08015 [Pseudomonadota bacterium]
MVISQAAVAFEIMTGSPADSGRMRQSFQRFGTDATPIPPV